MDIAMDIDAPDLSHRERIDVDPRNNLLKLAVFISILMVFLLILRYTFGSYLEYYGELIIERFGYAGMFIATLLMDTFIVPISPDIIIFVSIAGNVNTFWAIFTIALASMIGGNIGYLIGKFLGNREFVTRSLGKYERKGRYLMKKYGLWAVIVGAMTPIPFSAICWLAGMLDMKYTHFLAGVLWRIPRFLMWYIIIGMGFKGFSIQVL
jgi:membrane protein YqaA with SNARE-associated domain